MFSDYVRNDDLRIYAGDDRPITWPLHDRVTGGAVNLAGYTARAQVRATPESTEVLHEWSTALANVLLANSSLSLYVEGSGTWTWTHGVYDVHVFDALLRSEIIAWGRVTVIPTVTR